MFCERFARVIIAEINWILSEWMSFVGFYIKKKKKHVAIEFFYLLAIIPLLAKTRNCIWWWGANSEALESVEYVIIAIIPFSTVNRKGSVFYDQMDRF